MKLLVILLLGLPAVVHATASHLSEGPRPWAEKCEKDIKNFKASCKIAEDGTQRGSRVVTLRDCYGGSAPLVTIRYFRISEDSGSPNAGKHGCQVIENRANNVNKTTTYHESGTRYVRYDYMNEKDPNEVDREITLYTATGMVTCNKKKSATKFGWCGLVDSKHPSTKEKAYHKVEYPADSDVQALIGGQKTLEQVFSEAPGAAPAAPSAVIGSAPATAGQ